MQDELVLSRPRRAVVKPIVEKAVGKGWKSPDEIREMVSDAVQGELRDEDIYQALTKMQTTPDNPHKVEVADTKDGKKYRVTRVKGTVVETKTVKKWAPELIPLLEQLIRECKKERVYWDSVTLLSTADKIQKILDSMATSEKATND